MFNCCINEDRVKRKQIKAEGENAKQKRIRGRTPDDDKLLESKSLDGRLMNYSLKIVNRRQTIYFFKHVLGMRILRHTEFADGCEISVHQCCENRWSKTMVGYGPEDKFFALELIFNYKVQTYTKGNALVAITIKDDRCLNRAFNAKWPIAEGNILYAPGGYKFLIINEPSPPDADPIIKLTLGVQKLKRTRDYWHELLGFKIFGDTSSDSIMIGFRASETHLELKQVNEVIQKGQNTGRLAMGLNFDQQKDLELKVSKANKKVIIPLVPIETPGKAKMNLLALEDPDGHELYFFERGPFQTIAKYCPQDEKILFQMMQIEKDMCKISDRVVKITESQRYSGMVPRKSSKSTESLRAKAKAIKQKAQSFLPDVLSKGHSKPSPCKYQEPMAKPVLPKPSPIVVLKDLDLPTGSQEYLLRRGQSRTLDELEDLSMEELHELSPPKRSARNLNLATTFKDEVGEEMYRRISIAPVVPEDLLQVGTVMTQVTKHNERSNASEANNYRAKPMQPVQTGKAQTQNPANEIDVSNKISGDSRKSMFSQKSITFNEKSNVVWPSAKSATDSKTKTSKSGLFKRKEPAIKRKESPNRLFKILRKSSPTKQDVRGVVPKDSKTLFKKMKSSDEKLGQSKPGSKQPTTAKVSQNQSYTSKQKSELKVDNATQKELKPKNPKDKKYPEAAEYVADAPSKKESVVEMQKTTKEVDSSSTRNKSSGIPKKCPGKPVDPKRAPAKPGENPGVKTEDSILTASVTDWAKTNTFTWDGDLDTVSSKTIDSVMNICGGEKEKTSSKVKPHNERVHVDPLSNKKEEKTKRIAQPALNKPSRKSTGTGEMNFKIKSKEREAIPSSEECSGMNSPKKTKEKPKPTAKAGGTGTKFSVSPKASSESRRSKTSIKSLLSESIQSGIDESFHAMVSNPITSKYLGKMGRAMSPKAKKRYSSYSPSEVSFESDRNCCGTGRGRLTDQATVTQLKTTTSKRSNTIEPKTPVISTRIESSQTKIHMEEEATSTMQTGDSKFKTILKFPLKSVLPPEEPKKPEPIQNAKGKVKKQRQSSAKPSKTKIKEKKATTKGKPPKVTEATYPLQDLLQDIENIKTTSSTIMITLKKRNPSDKAGNSCNNNKSNRC